MESIKDNLIILTAAFGVGSVKSFKYYCRLLEHNALKFPMRVCISRGIFEKSDEDRLEKAIKAKAAENVRRDCKRHGIDIITIEDAKYPRMLRNISNAPLLLYVKGKLPDFNGLPSVCIVGPRKVSEFGQKSAYSIAIRIGKAGAIIVSGGAKGADRAAHIGALKSGSTTVAVLPCGIEYNYLYENKPMRDKIAQSGCLISEHPPTAGLPRNAFHIRNRILSGLCDLTVVIEAGVRSGALITAKNAVEQGRDVLVIPGNPTLPEYKGSNELLRDGAIPLIDTSDIFNLLIDKYADKLDIAKAFEKVENTEKTDKNKKIIKKSTEGLSKEAEIVYNYLDRPNFCIDDLADLNLSADDLLSVLTELEFARLIKPLPGGNYSLV